MTNLFSGRLTNQGYVNLETVTGLTFEAGVKYTIQSVGSKCFIREGLVGGGFSMREDDICYFTKKDGVDVFIKPSPSGTNINIADEE